MEGFGEVIPAPGREGREYGVVGGHLEHGDRDIGRAPEGEAAVEREVPQHRQGEGDQVAGPVAPGGEFVEQGEGDDLYQARAGGEQDELDDTPPFLIEKFPMFHVPVLQAAHLGLFR